MSPTRRMKVMDFLSMVIGILVSAVCTRIAIYWGNKDAKMTQDELKRSVDKLQGTLGHIAEWLGANTESGSRTFSFHSDGRVKGLNVTVTVGTPAVTLAARHDTDLASASDSSSPG
jgi:hypothetical protein